MTPLELILSKIRKFYQRVGGACRAAGAASPQPRLRRGAGSRQKFSSYSSFNHLEETAN